MTSDQAPPPAAAAVADTAPPATGRSSSRAASIARGAAIVATFTMLSRIFGLVRTLVFSQTVGSGCLGTAYTTANQVPNLIYELALGGALSSVMVPVLARWAERADSDPEAKAHVNRTVSAMLTWSIIICVPLTAAVVAEARPIASLLNPANANADCPRTDMIAATSTMITVFAPQIVLYGLSVVVGGLLQAYRRFTGYALAPVVGNVVIISSFLVFGLLDKGLPVGRTPLTAELVLAVGTTLNIAALVIVPAPPAWRLRVRLRPAFRFPPGVARRAGGFALVGVIEFIASDLAAVAVIRLANGRGQTGALVLYNYAGLVFNAVAAVLATSIVTSAFPVLSARDGDEFDAATAGSTRAVLLMSWLGTALIAAISVPTAHVLVRQPAQVPQLIEGFALYAPGVAATALLTNLSRVLFALRRLRLAAVALGGNWIAVLVADVVLAETVPARFVVGALALGNTIGQVLVAIPVTIAVRRIRGRAALQGAARANLAGIAAAMAASAAGVALSMHVPVNHRSLAVAGAVAAACCAAAVFAAVAFALDSRDLRAAIPKRWQRSRALDSGSA